MVTESRHPKRGWDFTGLQTNTLPATDVFFNVNDVTGLRALATYALGGGDEPREALVRVLWPNAYRIAWSILGDGGAAEDAAQAACAAICAKLSTLSDTRAFPGWAYRIIVSLLDDPIARLDIENAIGHLPEFLRLPLELHYFIGLSSREIGHALGVPAPTIRFRLMIARRQPRILRTFMLSLIRLTV